VKPDATAADVRNMMVDEAKRIYRSYWDSQRCDELPAGVDYSLFDYQVRNMIPAISIWNTLNSERLRRFPPNDA
jgi:lysozyme family protein